MMQQSFANQAVDILKADESVIGLAVGGSWLTNELDEFSDLDLILVTKSKIAGNKNKMLDYANKLGNLLTGFTGEHVGEPRLLICLYDNPLLHVDIKFLTLDEFKQRIETPVILLDTSKQLQQALVASVPEFPYPDYQWMEDRFWVWVHYALLKVGRGELLEALDFLGFLRITVLGPLLQIKNKELPRGTRKLETQLNATDFAAIQATIANYNAVSILNSLDQAIQLYKNTRKLVFENEIRLQLETEKKVISYFKEIQLKVNLVIS